MEPISTTAGVIAGVAVTKTVAKKVLTEMDLDDMNKVVSCISVAALPFTGGVAPIKFAEIGSKVLASAQSGVETAAVVKPVGDAVTAGPPHAGLIDKPVLDSAAASSLSKPDMKDGAEAICKSLDVPVDKQIADGANRVSLGHTVVNTQSSTIDGVERTTLNVEERMTDAKYFRYGNIADFVATIKAGELPSLHLCWLAMVDLSDKATCGIFAKYLQSYELADHISIRRKKIIIDDTFRTEDIKFPEKRDVINIQIRPEERFGPDLRETTSTIRTTSSEILREATTRKVTVLDAAEHATLESEAFQRITDTKLDIIGTCIEKKKSSTIMGWDTKKLAGGSVESSAVLQEKYETVSHALMSEKGVVGKEEGPRIKVGEEKTVPETSWDDGIITWIPGGSIANLGIKAYSGAEITKGDLFWAAYDLGGTAVGLGVAKYAFNAGAKAGLELGAKAGSKAVSRVTTQSGRVIIPKSVPKAAAKTVKASEKVGTKLISTPAKDVVHLGETELKELSKNTVYEKEGMRFRTDDRGRVKEAVGRLRDAPASRNLNNQIKVRKLGKPGDDAGHLIPARLGGPGDMVNMVPQGVNVNRSVIKSVENRLTTLLKDGHQVDYNIKVNYPHGGGTRPSSFKLEYVVDGKNHFSKIIINK